ncbi:molybdopterin synthase sulfur carrier subunit [Symbiobacterium terraclitae]|uniref:Molybdopterin synthase sulfur carrier subunit n=1 Tax=Symbiobacterium terraclitae TaxID=557451 RepID=A0ABS4JTQ3_9FIRM|nr:molybdopterin synthase sulfur carrier subunit [Symbiobacterium terraclitae]
MRIRLYGLLRDAADRRTAVEMDVCEGETVGSLLERLVAQYPRMRPLLFARPGVLLPHVMLVVNGRDVRDGRGLDTPITPEDDMAMFPPSAGG